MGQDRCNFRDPWTGRRHDSSLNSFISARLSRGNTFKTMGPVITDAKIADVESSVVGRQPVVWLLLCPRRGGHVETRHNATTRSQ